MILLSQRATKELVRIIAEKEFSADSYVRVGVIGGGCAGFSYTLGFDDSPIGESDLEFQYETVRIVCDPKSFLYLNGIEIDFEESLMGRGFKFKNPNATGGTCGCGESFGVKL